MNPHWGTIFGCDGWSVTHRQAVQQEAVIAGMASDMQNGPDCLPGSPLPAEEQLILSSHPSCSHGGFHIPKWLMGRPARSDSCCHYRFKLPKIAFFVMALCFCVTADGPPEPCWYCLRTQESGSQPESGQQVFAILSSSLPSRISEAMVLEDSISNYVVRKQK